MGTGKDLWVSNAGNWFVGFSNIISHLVRRVLSERGKLWASKHSQSECYIYIYVGFASGERMISSQIYVRLFRTFSSKFKYGK